MNILFFFSLPSSPLLCSSPECDTGGRAPGYAGPAEAAGESVWQPAGSDPRPAEAGSLTAGEQHSPADTQR